MDDIKIQVCRLCFSLIPGKNFSLITGYLKDMLQVIKADLILDIISSPVICTECSKTLQGMFSFKTNYFESQEKIESKNSKSKNVKLELRDIVSNSFNNRPKRRSTLERLKNTQLCRICLESIEEGSFISIGYDSDASILSMLGCCLPDLDLHLTSNPIMCLTCYGSLQKMYIFITMCGNNEKKIEAYTRVTGANLQNTINLHNVLQFSLNREHHSNVLENKSLQRDRSKIYDEEEPNLEHLVDDCLNYVMVKIETVSEDFEREDNKALTTKEASLAVKMEPRTEDGAVETVNEYKSIEMKSEDDSDCHRSQNVESTESIKHHATNKEVDGRSITYCSYCNFKTKYKYNLRRHLIATHKRKDVEVKKKIYKCPQCNFTSKWNIDLTRHLLSHVKPEALHCTRCTYSTNQNSQLIKHILSHVNVNNMDKYSFLQLTKKTN